MSKQDTGETRRMATPDEQGSDGGRRADRRIDCGGDGEVRREEARVSRGRGSREPDGGGRDRGRPDER